MPAANDQVVTIATYRNDLVQDENTEEKLTKFWKSFVARLFLITIALTLAAVAMVSYFALDQFQQKLRPEFQKQSSVVARTVASQLDRAFGAGIPMSQFYGMDDYLDGFLKANPTISYIVIATPEGKLLFGRGIGQTTALEIQPSPPKLLPLPAANPVTAWGPTESAGPALAPAATQLLANPERVQPAVAPKMAEKPEEEVERGNSGRLSAGVGDSAVWPISLPLVAVTGSPERSAADLDQVSTVLHAGYYDSLVWLNAGGQAVGRLHVGVSEKAIDQQNHEIVFDVVIVTLVALLVAFEFILFTVAVWIMTPTNMITKMIAAGKAKDFSWVLPPASGEFGRIATHLNNVTRRVNQLVADLREDVAELASLDIQGKITERASQVGQAAERSLKLLSAQGAKQIWETSLIFSRTPLFLFVFAQEMCRPFFPNFVGSVFTPPSWMPGLTLHAAISLPISIAMLIAAVMTPISGVWSDRIGRRAIFVGGCLFSAAGLVMSSLATSFPVLLGTWCFGAIGYGMVFIACQSYVLDNTSQAGRAQGIAIYLGAIMAGDICGPAIGGVLADRLGFRLTIVFAAGLTLVGAWLAFRHMNDAPASDRKNRTMPKWSDFTQLARNSRFLTLLVFASVPGKILLTGFLFYLAPIYLAELGNNQAVIGRVLMCYGLAALFVTPIAGSLFKSSKVAISAVGVAAMIQGASLLLLLWRSDTIGMVLAIGLFGLGQAISFSPQAALVPELTPKESEALGSASVLGIYRLIERLGTVVGPILVAVLLAHGTRAHTFLVMGTVMVGCGVLLLVLLHLQVGASSKWAGQDQLGEVN